MTRRTYLLGLAFTLLAGGCGSTSTSNFPPNALDRPTDVAFACYGDMRLVGADGRADVDDPLTVSAMPLRTCAVRSWPKSRVPGQESDYDAHPADARTNDAAPPDPPPDILPDLPTVNYWAFILQSVPGTVALVTWETDTFGQKDGSQAGWSGTELHYRDADPLTPGQSALAVGELPVAIASDRAGCQMITANAGSCDLSILDVESIVDEDSNTPPIIQAREVVNTAGDAVRARPAAMAAEPYEDTTPIGVECPAEPEGLVYVAYPQCHLVAAIRTATGAIEAGIRFNADGTVEVTDGNVSCPDECGGDVVTTDGERPVSIELVHDADAGTRRMVIGADNSPTLTVVELGPDYLPLAFDRVTLQGDIGVLDVALSPRIGMGGSIGFDDSSNGGGFHQFVYAVADDATVRVADVIGPTLHECDTQVDPRYLRTIADVSQLACMPVGDPTTPPRRALARTPGLEFGPEGVPVAVAIAQSAWNLEDRNPYLNPADAVSPDKNGIRSLIGYFAFIGLSGGPTAIATIDDDVYADFFSPTDPLGTMPPLAVPHQLRDGANGRNALPPPSNDLPPQFPDLRSCDEEPGADTGVGGPHVAGEEGGVDLLRDDDFMSVLKSYSLPQLRRIECDGLIVNENTDEDMVNDEHVDFPIWELQFPAPAEARDLAFPDLYAAKSENWYVAWEGILSRDAAGDDIDGPQQRHGVVDPYGGAITVDDPSHPFCSIGAQPYDILELIGCDPSHGDDDCSIGETCYVHPDSVAGTGSCLPSDQVDTLSSRCRDYLISDRRYTILSTAAGEVRAVPRRHVLETTPLDGCVADQQCEDLYGYQHYLHHGQHPYQGVPADDPLPERTFSCEPDPTRQSTVNQCVQTCSDTVACDDGSVCRDGYCLEGVVPSNSCLPGIQAYDVRGGEVLVVIGGQTGFLHPIIEDPSTGECVADPTASPLLTGRLPLNPPPCPGPDDYTLLTPNPCSTTLPHTEYVPDYQAGSTTCELTDAERRMITRDAPAIRFKNPALTFNLVDPWYPGDAMCREDRDGALGMIPTVHDGYQMVIKVESGFTQQHIGASAVLPVNVLKGPENSIWVMDEGERVPVINGDQSSRGEVFRNETWSPGLTNSIR